MFTCPHCGRQGAVFGADQGDTIDMGRVRVDAAQNNRRLFLRQNRVTNPVIGISFTIQK
jgi:hypothetical protein